MVLHDWLGASDAALTVGRFGVAAAPLLLVPTSLMGLTMPLVSAAGTVRAALGERLGLVYGVNTAGGVVGALCHGLLRARDARRRRHAVGSPPPSAWRWVPWRSACRGSIASASWRPPR